MLTRPLLVLAMGGRRTTERAREVSRRGERRVVRVDPSGQSYGDLLEQPAVAVRVSERGERDVAAAFRIASRERRLSRTGTMEHTAHFDTAADELGTRRLDVGH